jgi:Holliday junction resolvase
MSATSRRKGNRAEVAVVAALQSLGLEAVTSRAAREGLQGGADVICPGLPVVIEVKDQSRDALPSWLDQARQQAGEAGAAGAVVHKRRGRADAREWFVTMRLDEFVALVEVECE